MATDKPESMATLGFDVNKKHSAIVASANTFYEDRMNRLAEQIRLADVLKRSNDNLHVEMKITTGHRLAKPHSTLSLEFSGNHAKAAINEIRSVLLREHDEIKSIVDAPPPPKNVSAEDADGE